MTRSRARLRSDKARATSGPNPNHTPSKNIGAFLNTKGIGYEKGCAADCIQELSIAITEPMPSFAPMRRSAIQASTLLATHMAKWRSQHSERTLAAVDVVNCTLDGS